jgi:GH24 family phage-related lysozyme (muramidase)
MHASVLTAYPAFTTRFEGRTPFLYTDKKGYVTTGIGNLVENLQTHEPTPDTFTLGWKRTDGSLASHQEILDAWKTVKAAWPGVQSFASQKLTSIRLDKEAIDRLVQAKLLQNETILRRRFPGYDRWPADAQLGVHSMSWAMGSGFDFPKFVAAVNKPRPDFRAAAAASFIYDPGNPIEGRNAANRQLFLNAAHALERGHDVSTLFYPQVLQAAAFGVGGLLLAGAAAGALFLAYRHFHAQRVHA